MNKIIKNISYFFLLMLFGLTLFKTPLQTNLEAKIIYHGYIPGKRKLDSVEVGKTIDQVLSQITYPSFEFEQEFEQSKERTFIYMSANFQKFPFIPPLAYEWRAYFVKFDKEGKVKEFGYTNQDPENKKEIVTNLVDFDDYQKSLNEVFYTHGSISPFREINLQNIDINDFLRNNLEIYVNDNDINENDINIENGIDDQSNNNK